MASQTPATVANQLFRDYTTDQLVDHNFDREEASIKALRIFLVSFGEYQRFCPQLYNQKFDEYLTAIKELYGVPNIDQTIIQNESKSLERERIKVTIGVKQFRGQPLTNPRIVIIIGRNQSKPFPLNTNRLIQTDVRQSQTILLDELKNHRRQKTDIVIKLRADNLERDKVNVFTIGYHQIPVEGFEDWFQFGEDVRLLIKISFEIYINDINERRSALDFHLHSIIYMLRQRLNSFRNQPTVGPTHRPFGRKCKVSYTRKSREPNEQQVFWSTPMSIENQLNSIRSVVDSNEDQYSRGIKDLLKSDVKFNDLQIGFGFTDSFNDSVCLCSEWCNWNAFFHYNPIYRFLLVQNNQLFLSSRTNVTDMYLFATTFCAYEAGLNLEPNQDLPLTPVLRLMSCADNYRQLLYQKFYLTKEEFRDEYDVSYPDPQLMNGLTYNLLRNDVRIADLWLQTDVNPFSNICIENICNFYRLYSSLHLWCSTRTTLVDTFNIKKWFKELDQTSRKKYRNYLKLGYNQRIAWKIPSYDSLFTEDYEYLHLSCDPNIKSIRNQVIKKGLNDNPLNTVVICNDLLSTLMSVHKFIKIVENSLPLANTFPSCADVFVTYKTLDADFNGFAKDLKIDFKFDENMIQQKNLEQMRQNLTLFFTLKHYSIASGLQTEFITSLNRVKRVLKTKTRPEQTSIEFNFIWRTTLFEYKLRKDFPDLYLFEINPNIEKSFVEFYDNFWGKANHEVNQTTQYPANISSGFHEYQRLYFWWRNEGNNRLVFRRVVDSLRTGFEDIVNRSQYIYDSYILPTNRDICQTYDYHLEVTEVLIQYLVKTDCYMILSSIAVFLKKVHSLQIPLLVRRKVCFCMSKPGWVPIFRTMRTALHNVGEIETLYIDFDDEFNRISTIISNTKQMIRNIYRDFYRKLIADWVTEINKMAELKNLYTNSEDFVIIHLAVGLSFLVAFVDDFRSASRFYRKFLMSVLEFTSEEPHQMLLNNYDVICTEYQTHPQVIQTAMPLLWPLWQQEIPSVDFKDWDQMDGQQLDIDLNAADS